MRLEIFDFAKPNLRLWWSAVRLTEGLAPLYGELAAVRLTEGSKGSG